ncbi:glycoside hydrolase family 140 protein [Paenibacillus daejeonensis]|uniref:glycoside hydrolase family 140 protein n=1 Tax=Paenibacillus daejeonensis TaxID=135193 RepID=UPI0003608C08|nr:glycoside hydrolase family 140 protein [Paenibacillus daejeonensis]
MTQAVQPLAVSRCGRYLERADGSAFFWLGDTAWELFHKLTREEAQVYLDIRAEQGFTVIQAVALAELDGLQTPNAYGRLPFQIVESATTTQETEDVDAQETGSHAAPSLLIPDTDGPYSYWDHVDAIVSLAAERGLYIALLPTWGDKFNRKWGLGPEVFAPENAAYYGNWLGERYRSQTNVIWVLGGDRPLESEQHCAIVDAMAAGLKEGDGGSHLMSFHPPGAASSADHVHDRPWVDFHMIQSGHGEAEITNYRRIERDYSLTPVRPVLDAEPCYEDHPVAFRPENGYFDEADVRRAAYYAMLSGAFGHTYGHHSVWPMSDGLYASVAFDEPGVYFIMSWKEALLRPGAEQMRHLRKLLERQVWPHLKPDQELLAANLEGAAYCVAARCGSEALIYSPQGLYVDARLDRLGSGVIQASWYDPRDGSWSETGQHAANGTVRFYAPTSGRGQDWILCLRREDGECTK